MGNKAFKKNISICIRCIKKAISLSESQKEYDDICNDIYHSVCDFDINKFNILKNYMWRVA